MDALPIIEARSPKAAAEKYIGRKVRRHYEKWGGDIVVQETIFPYRMFIYV